MEILFNFYVMKELIKQDKLLAAFVKDLGGDARAYKVVFNSEILGDSIMEGEYQKVAQRMGLD
jgi:hypothetical protein